MQYIVKDVKKWIYVKLQTIELKHICRNENSKLTYKEKKINYATKKIRLDFELHPLE